MGRFSRLDGIVTPYECVQTLPSARVMLNRPHTVSRDSCGQASDELVDNYGCLAGGEVETMAQKERRIPHY